MENKKFDHLKFYVAYHPDEAPAMLYVANTKDNNLFWYDHKNGEWLKSIYGYSDIVDDKDFKEVEKWDDGYSSTADAIDKFGEEPDGSIEN